jgi:hypothetical protein
MDGGVALLLNGGPHLLEPQHGIVLAHEHHRNLAKLPLEREDALPDASHRDIVGHLGWAILLVRYNYGLL